MAAPEAKSALHVKGTENNLDDGRKVMSMSFLIAGRYPVFFPIAKMDVPATG